MSERSEHFMFDDSADARLELTLAAPPGTALPWFRLIDLRIDTDVERIKSWSASLPDAKWLETDAAGHVHRFTVDDEGMLDIPTLRYEERHFDCDGIVCDGVCGGEGYDIRVLVCRDCGEWVQPRTVPDDEARGPGIPYQVTYDYRLRIVTPHGGHELGRKITGARLAWMKPDHTEDVYPLVPRAVTPPRLKRAAMVFPLLIDTGILELDDARGVIRTLAGIETKTVPPRRGGWSRRLGA